MKHDETAEERKARIDHENEMMDSGDACIIQAFFLAILVAFALGLALGIYK
jgi:hypothetical protein